MLCFGRHVDRVASGTLRSQYESSAVIVLVTGCLLVGRCTRGCVYQDPRVEGYYCCWQVGSRGAECPGRFEGPSL